MKDYVEIENSLKDLPITWYPALLMTLVQEAIKKKTWKQGKINIWIKNLEDKLQPTEPDLDDDKDKENEDDNNKDS